MPKKTSDEGIPRVHFLKKSDTRLEVEILSLASLFKRSQKMAHPVEKPHRVDFHQLLFITRGKGLHFIDFQPFHYQPGSLLMIARGQVHAFSIQPDTDGLLLLFTDHFIEKNLSHEDVLSVNRLMNYHLRNPHLEPALTSGEELPQLLNLMAWEYSHQESFAKEEILRLYLKLLLVKIARIQRTASAPPKNVEWFSTFERFRVLLEQNLTTTRNAVDYADMLGISSRHLGRICRAMANATAKQFIDSFIILEIKRELATSSEPIQEITYQFGFDEPTNFVKYFKKHSGQSPARFRKSFSE